MDTNKRTSTESTSETRKKIKLSASDLSWDSLYMNHLFTIEGDNKNLELLIYDIFMNSWGFEGVHSHPQGEEISLRLRSFIKCIRLSYHMVPYHSFAHATHVFLSIAVMLHHIQTSGKKFTTVQSPVFTQVECIALLVASLIHDVDHFGVFNSTLMKEGHEYSKLYHGKSIAENRSISITFTELSNIDNNFINLMLTPDELLIFHKLVIDIVLSTDVADPDRRAVFNSKIVALFQQIDISIVTVNDVNDFKCYNEKAVPMKINIGLDQLIENSEQKSRYVQMLSNPDSRCTVLMLMMQLCDIASSTQGITGMKIWVARFISEQMLAFNNGRMQGVVEVDSFCISQKAFLSSTVNLISMLKYTEVCSDSWINVMETNIISNLEYWNEFGEADTRRWLNSCSRM